MVATAAMLAVGSSSVALACGTVANAADVLKPRARIIVGEIHGTNETPRAVADLVCLASKAGPVRLGLEFSPEEQGALDTFLTSAGSQTDQQALFNGKWLATMQDGTHSVAMLALIESVRQLRQAGADVGIFAFSNSKQQTQERDDAMADNLSAAFNRTPNAIFVVLTGNTHAQRRPDEPKEVVMAGRMIERGIVLVALDSHYGVGTTWACYMDPVASAKKDRNPVTCGPAVIGEGPSKPVALVLSTSANGLYDGWLDVGAASFSPPAAVPMTKAQEATAVSMRHRVESRIAYETKQYRRCADSLKSIDRKLRLADDAYATARCLALAGDTNHAFEALTAAIVSGFSDRERMEQDTDLQRLRSDSRWKGLLRRLPR